jgi:hypothetical protein
MDFDVRALQNGSGEGVVGDVAAPLNRTVGTTDIVTRQCFIPLATNLSIELHRVSDGATLATFRSPQFDAVINGTTSLEVAAHAFDFAYVFRLADPLLDPEGLTWLESAGRDLRTNDLPSKAYVYATVNGTSSQSPADVVRNTGLGNGGGALTNIFNFAVGNPSLLLDRYPGSASSPAGTSFNEDVPVFELPRSPLLSLGQLQHLTLPALQPFWFGRSAASTGPAEWNNALFDQHFFSGLGSGSNWSSPASPLPNTLARVLRHKPDGTDVATTDLDASGLSAKYVLQGGAFNLNSTEPDAWAAVLRSVRFPTGREFKYLDADDTTGTNADTATATLEAAAAFPRFSHSAQETYKTTPNYPQSDSNSSTSSSPVMLHTEYYRQGFRTLDAATVTSLAKNISDAVKARIAASGPFTSLEEFLNPAAGAGTPSLLEQAILDLNLNDDPANPGTPLPFSSSFLTQADIMTALAPALFVRSDTFTVRAYGEATNPTTGATEGKAWCEAIVQRFPEPFAPGTPSQPTDDEYKTPPGDFGRRFKIISLRWLTKSDI